MGVFSLRRIDFGESAIDLESLQRAVTFVEPSAILVPSRILRRVTKRDRRMWILGGRVSRRSEYTISASAIRPIVEPSEVGLSTDFAWPESVELLAQPEPEEFTTTSDVVLLNRCWRQLFRAKVRCEFAKVLSNDHTATTKFRDAVGKSELAEARSVLIQESLISDGTSEDAFLCEFAAQFLDLSHFAPRLRSHAFPAIEDYRNIEAVLDAMMDRGRILSATKPPGAEFVAESSFAESSGPEPDQSGDDPPGIQRLFEGEAEPEIHSGRRDFRSRALSKRAEEVSRRGNDVRAAILHTKASKLAKPDEQEDERAKARASLKQLTHRLQKALFIRKGEAEHWAEALSPLLRRAARGFWSPEARLLYDLQKVCVDHEREIYRLDTVGWLLSLGKRPLRHPLPHFREVTTSNHLRSAARRLPKVALSREDRARLELLLQPAVHHAENALRDRFRPWIDSTLESTWVRPKNLPGRVAYRKLVEELLDQIVTKGFLNLGDLRDAASRSNLKMPDLEGPREFVKGDRLLDADHALAESLDGVHRRGEIYLRTLQRFSALAFGTHSGRFLTLFAALPYGGAFMTLMGIQEIFELTSRHLYEFHAELVNRQNVLMLGTLALAAINVRRFRNEVFAALYGFGRVLRAMFVTLPSWVLRNPLFHRVLTSTLVVALWRTIGKPVLLAAPAWLLTKLLGFGHADSAGVALFVFLASCFMFNTRAGQRAEELAVEGLAEIWREFIGNWIPGLFRAVMEIFGRLLEWVEKVIYAVDEWLRFQEGQSRFSLGSKAVLGLAWGIVAYLVRIYVNLLIEPQINPIKHFPVVTVSHKVMIPFLGRLTELLSAPMTPFIGKWAAEAIALANVFLLPGFFGFLVWELKSNWKLYEANRPKQLEPILVGSHGETVERLLRPGFHSGTLPKLFNKLRKAEQQGGRDKAVVKRRTALHHVEESFRRFVERDLVALLNESRALGGSEIVAGSIRLATNRIRFELITAGEDHAPLRLEIVERDGVLWAAVFEPGWAETVVDESRETLNNALIGFFKISGISIIADSMDDPHENIDINLVEVSWEIWARAWDQEASGGVVEPLVEGFAGVPGLRKKVDQRM